MLTLKLSKKYLIADIGISSPQYLAARIEEFLIERNYEVTRNGELLRFRVKYQNRVIRGQCNHGSIHILTKADKIVMNFRITNIHLILILISMLVSITAIIIDSQIIPVHPGFIVVGFILTPGLIFSGLYHYFDARKILRRIDEFVWSLK